MLQKKALSKAKYNTPTLRHSLSVQNVSKEQHEPASAYQTETSEIMGYPRKQTVFSKVKKSFNKFKPDSALLQLVVEPEVSGGDVKPRKSPAVSAKKQQLKPNQKPKL